MKRLTVIILAALSLSLTMEGQTDNLKDNLGIYLYESMLDMSGSKPAQCMFADTIPYTMNLPNHFTFEEVDEMVNFFCDMLFWMRVYVDWQGSEKKGEEEWRSLTIRIDGPEDHQVYYFFVVYDYGNYEDAGYNLEVTWWHE